MHLPAASCIARTSSHASRRRHSVAPTVVALVVAGALAGCGAGDGGFSPGADDSRAAAAPPQIVAVDAERPAAVPDDFVVTPMGYFHPSCVRDLSERAWAAATPCTHPHFDRAGHAIAPDADEPARGSTPPFTGGNWITHANATIAGVGQADRIRIVGDVRVPAPPAFAGNQVLYIFNGLEPRATGNEILQPVLGWTRGRWTMQNWDCCVQGTVFNDGAVAVQRGDMIRQIVGGSTNDGFNISWNRNGGAFKTFHVDGNGKIFNWAFAAVLEAYNISRCDMYPDDAGTIFSNVAVHVDGVLRDPAWQAAAPALSPDCSTHTSIAGDTFTLHYND